MCYDYTLCAHGLCNVCELRADCPDFHYFDLDVADYEV